MGVTFKDLINTGVNGLGRGVDRILGIVSPAAEIRRTINRRQLNQYAAAKTDRLTGSWNPTGTNINNIIKTSAVPVRNRIRQLVRDFPPFDRAINSIVDFSVGTGIVPQARVRNGNQFDEKLNTKIEDEFARWVDVADVAFKLNYYEMMRLAKRQDIEAGEFIIIKVHRKDKRRRVPFALQMYESEWLTGVNVTAKGKNKVDQGIEYDIMTGEVVAYHFTDPDSWGKAIRIKAENVVHGFDTLRPGQRRGISPYTAGVLIANDMGELIDSTLGASKMASRYMAIVTTTDAFTYQKNRSITNPNGGDNKLEELENAILEYIQPGEKIEFANSNIPGDSFNPLMNFLNRTLSIVTKIPYPILTADYSGISYSNQKGIRNDFDVSLKPITARHILHYGEKTVNPWMTSAVMVGVLPINNYFQDPYKYQSRYWQIPGSKSIDPLRETKAHVDQLKNFLNSPQRILAEKGIDPVELLDEIEEWEMMLDKRGLESGEDTSTSMANNPAKIGASENEEETDNKKEENEENSRVLTISK